MTRLASVWYDETGQGNFQMERAKITLGELREKYERARERGVITIFIGDAEIYVAIIKDLIEDMESFNTSDDTIVEVSKTNIFDER